jgi:UDPglucose 6-dehydrogenase
MNITVIGTGYVGLVTGACLADIGHQVVCVDNNQDKIRSLQAGQIPIYEPGLEAIVHRCTAASASGSLTFTSELGEGMADADVIFIAVGTPSLPGGEPDLRFVEAVAREVGTCLMADPNRYRVIVNKSTVPIGSGDWVRMVILDGAAQVARDRAVLVGMRSGTGISLPETHPHPEILRVEAPRFDVVSNPEFLREGSAIWDTFNPDRIVIGSESAQAVDIMRRLYAPILERTCSHADTVSPIPLVVTDLASAEMIKYAANAFLATKISFINEIANICERVGADVQQVGRGIGLDSRIGPQFLKAGLGWGGSCFLKDVSALIHTSQDYNYEARLLQATVGVNWNQRYRMVEKLQQELKVLKGKTVGLLGLTFKPDTDDMRDAPALTLIEQLLKLGARVRAFDPIISPRGALPSSLPIVLVQDSLSLAADADALILVTEWQQFQSLPFLKMARVMRRPLLVDARNALDQIHLQECGFKVVGVGR